MEQPVSSAERPRSLYIQRDYPIFQNRMYDSREEARNCPRGNIDLRQDSDTGLIRNTAFEASLMAYDSN